jgi:hypothetical protein
VQNFVAVGTIKRSSSSSDVGGPKEEEEGEMDGYCYN